MIAAGALVFAAVGLDVTVQINNRKFLDELFASIGLSKDMFVPVMRTVDKLDKIGRDGVNESLQKLNIPREVLAKIDSLVSLQGTNDDKIEFLEKMLKNKEAIAEIKETLSLLELYKLKCEISIDFSLVRGLDYYTGIVFEYKSADKSIKPSLGGGGRYDNLIGSFTGKKLPAVGCALGVDVILEILNFSSSPKQTYANVFIATINDGNYPYALRVANALRANGIAVDLNCASRNISNQLAYANSLKFKYAIVVGDSEQKEEKVKIRNLVDGTESSLNINDAIRMLNEK